MVRVEKSTALFHAFHSPDAFLFLYRRSLYFVLFLDREPQLYRLTPEQLEALRDTINIVEQVKLQVDEQEREANAG